MNLEEIASSMSRNSTRQNGNFFKKGVKMPRMDQWFVLHYMKGIDGGSR